jgi:hypothetical protein
LLAVSVQELARWCQAGHWEELRKSLLNTKGEQLRMFYDQLAKLNIAIAQGDGYPTDKQANTQRKLTAAIARVESEDNLGTVIMAAKSFLDWLQKYDKEQDKVFMELFDCYIKERVKEARAALR